MFFHLSISRLLVLAVVALFVIPVAVLGVQKNQRQKPPIKKRTKAPDVALKPPPVKKPELVIQNGHADTVRALAFSPDGKLVASASTDKTIRLWEVDTGKMLRVLDHHRDNV